MSDSDTPIYHLDGYFTITKNYNNIFEIQNLQTKELITIPERWFHNYIWVTEKNGSTQCVIKCLNGQTTMHFLFINKILQSQDDPQQIAKEILLAIHSAI